MNKKEFGKNKDNEESRRTLAKNYNLYPQIKGNTTYLF